MPVDDAIAGHWPTLEGEVWGEQEDDTRRVIKIYDFPILGVRFVATRLLSVVTGAVGLARWWRFFEVTYRL